MKSKENGCQSVLDRCEECCNVGGGDFEHLRKHSLDRRICGTYTRSVGIKFLYCCRVSKAHLTPQNECISITNTTLKTRILI